MTALRVIALAAAFVAAAAFAQAPSPAPSKDAKASDAKAKDAKPAVPAQKPGAEPAKPAAAAGAQPLKGRVKEGLYEVVREHEITGIPGIPKEAQKGSERRTHCMKKDDIERAVQPGQGCSVKGVKQSPTKVSIAMACADGTTTDLDMTFNPAGYTTDMRTKGMQDGKPFTSRFRSTAKFLGACPPG